MLTQTNVQKPGKAGAFDWNGWTLQLGRNEEGTFGIWTFKGQPVVMVRAAQA